MSATRHDHWGVPPHRATNPRTGGRWPKNRFSGIPSWRWLCFNLDLNDESTEVSCSTCCTACWRSGRPVQRLLVGGRLAHLQGTDEEYVFVALVEDSSVAVIVGALVSWAPVSSVSSPCVVCPVLRSFHDGGLFVSSPGAPSSCCKVCFCHSRAASGCLLRNTGFRLLPHCSHLEFFHCLVPSSQAVTRSVSGSPQAYTIIWF